VNLHLSMNESSNVRLVTAKDLPGRLNCEVGPKVFYGLRGKVIEQVGMIVIGHVIEIHRPGLQATKGRLERPQDDG
jgi:hypothetical protein